VESFEELNDKILAKATAFKEKSESFAQDARSLLPLVDYDPCELVSRKADKTSFVRFDTNSYSVPTQFAHALSAGSRHPFRSPDSKAPKSRSRFIRDALARDASLPSSPTTWAF
jgi:hypothetical protein